MNRKNDLWRLSSRAGSRFLLLPILILALSPLAAFAERIAFEDNWAAPGFKLSEQNPAGIEVIFSVPYLDLQDVMINGEAMKNLSIPGILLPSDAGTPNLPGTGRFIALPQGAEAIIQILDYRTEVIHNLNLAPAPILPLDTDPVVRYEKNPQIYGTDAAYPPEPFKLSARTDMRGVDVVILGITPFQYNPVTKDLTVYKDVRIKVDFLGGNGHFGNDRLRSRWWDPILQEHLLNYAALPNVDYNRRLAQASDEDNVEYLIIIPNDPFFQAWADTLKRWRNEQGILTGITTLTEIGGNDATLIENYINNAYNNWTIPPVAILLLSDYQTSGSDLYGITSPVWSGYCVSDNMYADVNGNDLPEINIARITAQTYQQLQTMINKMLTYERNPYTDPGFYQNPLIAAGWQSDRWFVLCSEIVYGFLQNELGKTPVRQYAGASGPQTIWSTTDPSQVVNYFGPTGLGYIPNNPSYLTNWSGNAAGINAAINSGAFMVLHRDHGGETGWGTPAYNNSNVQQLTNTMYPFVFSLNCLTGKYNWSSECFTEAFHRLQYGALGLTAASEVSYSFVNDTYCWGMMDAMWPEFDPGYGNPDLSWNLRPGFANASGKYYLAASSWPAYPSYKVYTYHLFHHHGDAFLTLYSQVPQNLTVLHNPVLLGGATSFSVSANAGSLISLSVNGAIIGTADGTGAPVAITIPPQNPGLTVRVTVTLANYYRYMQDVQVIPPSGPYVTYNSCEINDAVVGNNNGQWDYGETTDLSIGVKNIGIEPAANVNVTISESDPLITIIDNAAFYGTINAGDSLVVPNGFRVQAAANTPDGHTVAFTLTATSGSNTWTSYFACTVHAPEGQYTSHTISDPAPGNQNGNLDPGESGSITVTITNAGTSSVPNLLVGLTTVDPYVTITGASVNVGTVAPNGTVQATYQIAATASCPQEHDAALNLSFNGGGYSGADGFVITIGDNTYAPTGPDGYGYYAYDVNDGVNAPDYIWNEIAPAAGGAGTELTALTGQDDMSAVVDLPFTFQFYGQDYTQVTICTNGWIAMGSQPAEVDWSNSAIPNADGPAAMIAPFWEDMNMETGGQIATYSNFALGVFTVEFYRIPQWTPATAIETFEIVLYDPALYPTSTGDGKILVQYYQVSDPTSCTAGIENPAETIGLQYLYDGAYDLHATPLAAEMAIMYMTSPSAWTVSIGLNPISPPIQIPATGGSFNYNVSVTNSGTSPATFDAWIMILLPSQTWYGPVLGPFNLTLPAGITLTRQRTQNVPASAPAGQYTYEGYVGTYPSVKLDSSGFNFTKLATGDGLVVNNWENYGDSFAPFLTQVAPAVLPEVYALEQNYPNPFNPVTAIRYQISDARYVSLRVYDTVGRLVATLVEGYLEAGIYDATFDASDLASGIYLYRLEAGGFTATKKMVLMK